MPVRKAQGQAWICSDCAAPANEENTGIAIQPPCNCPDCDLKVHGEFNYCPYCGEGFMKPVVNGDGEKS